MADLPVYLVLTKCDELAKPGDTFSKWLQRMEDAKRKLGEFFAAFWADDLNAPPFGTIDLKLWATAIGRPVLADRPAAAEPSGVVELFRQCLASADQFRCSRRRTVRRLFWSLFIIILLLAGSLLLTIPSFRSLLW